MAKQITISICKPNKQIKSWHILKSRKPNIWYPIAYIHEPKRKDKDFKRIMDFLRKSN